MRAYFYARYTRNVINYILFNYIVVKDGGGLDARRFYQPARVRNTWTRRQEEECVLNNSVVKNSW